MQAQIEPDDEFSSDPPSEDHYDLQVDVGVLLNLLDKVEQGHAAAFNLSTALSFLDHRRPKGSVLTPTQRDDLAHAIIRLHGPALQALPATIDHMDVWMGLSAAFAQVLFWGATPEQRAKASSAFVTQMNGYARVLRNALHNHVLKDVLRTIDDERLRTEAIENFPDAPCGDFRH